MNEALFFPDRLQVPLRAAAALDRCTVCFSDDLQFPEHDNVGAVVCACGHMQPHVLFLDKRPKYKGFKDEDMVKDECVDMFIDPTLPKSSMTIVMSQGGSLMFQGLRRLQNGYLPSEERATLHIMDTIRAHAARFPTSVVQDAAVLFRKLQENSKKEGDCTRGDVRKALIASCVMYSCRMLHVIKTPDEVARAFELTDDQFTKGWSRFQDICAHRGFTSMSLTPLKAQDFIHRCAKRLALPWSITAAALRVADHVEDQRWCTNNVPSSVAGAIFLVLPQFTTLAAPDVLTVTGLTAQAIAHVCDMSVSTLQKIAKLLLTLDKTGHVEIVRPVRRNKKRTFDAPSLSSAPAVPLDTPAPTASMDQTP